MNKINGKYTFSEGVAKVMEERKRLSVLLGDKLQDDFKLPDPAECLIEEVEREKKLLDKFNKLKKEYEDQKETFYKTYEQLVDMDKKCHKLSKENEELNKQITTLTAKNKKLGAAESNQKVLKLTKENENLTNEKEELTRQITTLTTKNKNLYKKCKQLKKEKEPKLSLSHNQNTTLSNTFISSLAASYEKSEKEKEREHEKLVESNKKVLKLTEENKNLTNEVKRLKQKDAMRENQIESLNEYINFLESRLNNQADN